MDFVPNDPAMDEMMGLYCKSKVRFSHIAPKLDFQKELGKGSFGTVSLVRNMSKDSKLTQGSMYAVKSVDICMANRGTDSAFHEWDLFQFVSANPHPFVLSLLDDFVENVDGKPIMKFVVEYFPQTLLGAYELLRSQDQEMPVEDIQLYFFQLFHALAHLHNLDFIHRDIKLDNMLVDPQTKRLKLCDFGNSIHLEDVVGEGGRAHKSFFSVPPELLFCEPPVQCCANDMWATGCVMIALLPCHFHFATQCGTELGYTVRILQTIGDVESLRQQHGVKAIIQRIQRHMSDEGLKPSGLSPRMRGMSSDIVDLLEKILVTNPDNRLTAAQACAHESFATLFESDSFTTILALIAEHDQLVLSVLQEQEQEPDSQEIEKELSVKNLRVVGLDHSIGCAECGM